MGLYDLSKNLRNLWDFIISARAFMISAELFDICGSINFLLFHFTSHEVPCLHFLQRTSYRLNIPQQEDEQYGNADQTGDAVELTDVEHALDAEIAGKNEEQHIHQHHLRIEPVVMLAVGEEENEFQHPCRP